MIHANREETELDRWRRLRSKGVSWPIEGPLDWSEASAISSPKLPPRPVGSRRWKGRRRAQGRRGRGVVEVRTGRGLDRRSPGLGDAGASERAIPWGEGEYDRPIRLNDTR